MLLEALTTYAWVGALVFARLGAVFMLAPGLGEPFVSTRIRLTAALLMTAAIAPAIADKVPSAPATVGLTALLVVFEVLTGLMMGMVSRIFISALNVAGQVAGLQSGLGFAQQFDPSAGQTGSALATFLSLLGITLIMVTGLHQLMIAAAAASYERFPPGTLPPIGDSAEFAVQATSEAFTMGIQIAAPVIVFAMIFNLSLGLVNRLVPQIQVFFVAMPASILLSLVVFMVGIGSGIIAWLEAYERFGRFLI
jgi:flagellar biosynthesis protein FliR